MKFVFSALIKLSMQIYLFFWEKLVYLYLFPLCLPYFMENTFRFGSLWTKRPSRKHLTIDLSDNYYVLAQLWWSRTESSLHFSELNTNSKGHLYLFPLCLPYFMENTFRFGSLWTKRPSRKHLTIDLSDNYYVLAQLWWSRTESSLHRIAKKMYRWKLSFGIMGFNQFWS